MANQINRAKMNIYASLTILIWATAFPVTRMIGDQIDQYALALIRCVSASVLLLAIGFFNKISIPKDRNTWIKIIVAGVCGFAIYIVVFSLGFIASPRRHPVSSSRLCRLW